MMFTIVAVFHLPDLPFIRLQARSLKLYLQTEFVNSILLIANGDFGGCPNWRNILVDAYGDLAAMLRLVHSNDVIHVPQHTHGWVSQQILKLAAARSVTTERYLVLDAKNHLVFPLEQSFLEANRRIRTFLRNYESHPLRPRLENAARYFSLDQAKVVQSFLPTVTPFMFATERVRALLDYVEHRERRSFSEAFIKIEATEFSLFGAYMLSLGESFEESFDLSGTACPVVWEESLTADQGKIDAMIAKCGNLGTPFFSIHRRALRHLSVSQRRSIASFWARRQLFCSLDAGMSFLSDSSGSPGDRPSRFNDAEQEDYRASFDSYKSVHKDKKL